VAPRKRKRLRQQELSALGSFAWAWHQEADKFARVAATITIQQRHGNPVG
jgi:hypothetical protein